MDQTRQKLALGTWNLTSLWGKELELVREVDPGVFCRSGEGYNERELCPRSRQQVSLIPGGCWPPPGLPFVTYPVCDIHG